jgi:hypothetical protein
MLAGLNMVYVKVTDLIFVLAKQCFAVQLPAPPQHSYPRKDKFFVGDFFCFDMLYSLNIV